MKKLFLMKKPDLFQGEKNLTKNKDYFEGWYFKNTNKDGGVSFIPGINIENNKPKAFVQVITNNESHFVNYDIEDFTFSHNPFAIKIRNNFFSKDGIHIDIKTDQLDIKGDVQYSNNKNINTDSMNPNIMGPFSYVPFMECNHAILSMQSNVNGSIDINNTIMNFDNDMGYIEKDWGTSFPKSYIWCQGNNFKKSNASFMLSVADVPFKMFKFRGVICVLMVGDKEYKFTTYNNARLVTFNIKDDSLDITLKKGEMYINIHAKHENAQKLAAPVKGKMGKDIFESITSAITVTLKQEDSIIFSDTSRNCGMEIVR